MATIQSNGTGGGNWSSGSSWNGGVMPAVGVDDAVILNGDTITKDTAAHASKDCLNLSIDTGGILAIGANSLECTMLTSSTGYGKITGTTGSLECDLNRWRGQWDIQGTDKDNMFEIKRNGGNLDLHWDDSYGKTGTRVFRWCKFDGQGGGYTMFYAWKAGETFEHCDFKDHNLCGSTNTISSFKFYDCYFYDATAGYGVNSNSWVAQFFDCVFGDDRDGTGGLTNSKDFHFTVARPCIAECFNCEFHSSTVTGNHGVGTFFYSKDHDKVRGDWQFASHGGRILRSTDAARDGTYGLEFIPDTSQDDMDEEPLTWRLEYKVEAGDTIDFTVDVFNDDGDLNLSGDDLEIILDPENTWGRREVVDADDINTPDLAYETWYTVNFTGGVCSGTSEKGMFTVELVLRKTATNAVLYFADPAFTIS